MKKKFSLWLNIATICLCVCAIAIGVYAAQSATLSVTGSIGFTAHKLGYEVESATIQGYLTAPNDSTTYQETPQTLTYSNGEIALPKGTDNAIYFSDLNGEGVQDIIIKLKLKNTSTFPIEATLTLPTDTTIQNNIKFSVEQGVAQMGASGETQTQEMIITMSLKNPTTNTGFAVTSLSFNVDLVKYQKIKGDSTTGYYVTMGSNVVTDSETGIQTVKPVKWFPFAKYVGTGTEGADTNGYVSFAKTEKPEEGEKYYFISENILDFDTGDKPTPETGSVYGNAYGVAYANKFNSSYKSTKTNYADFYAQDYLISNVRELLTSEDGVQQYALWDDRTGAIPYGSTISLLKEYGLQGYTYASITERKVSELHETGCDGKEIGDFKDTEQSADKLWLLSFDELDYITGVDTQEFSKYTALKSTTFRGAVNGSWWLRSPESNGSCYAWYVYFSGGVFDHVVNCALGVRPAFTLAI